MGCCGQSRTAYGSPDEARHRPAPPAPAAAPWAADLPVAVPAAAAVSGGVRLRFTGQAHVRVRGPVTGVDYVFSGNAPVGTVDGADADGLLRTGYFRRAY